jgi:hypothetical protein
MDTWRKRARVTLMATGLAVGWAGTADAGCRVSLQGQNGGAVPIRIEWSGSQVRIRTGTWALIALVGQQSTQYVEPGQAFSRIFELDLGCNHDRRYRFRLRKGTSEDMHYHPSADAFTSSVVINLGNLNRFFPP